MYTIQENVRIVIALLKQYNIRHIVVSPGGTNIPISQAVQDDPFFICYSVPDERSAMYFAIGLYLQTGEIIATSCTSAQATRNYVPGLTEAFYKHAPILAITTSKLERFQYQDYMQAPDQTSLPKDAVKSSFDLPPVTDDNTRVLCIHNARTAIIELLHRSPGPIQLNIRIIDAQQGMFEKALLPKIRMIKRYMAWDSWNDVDLSGKKVLIVIGEHRPFTNQQLNKIERFCESFNVAVYVNHFSNYHGKYSFAGNLLASCGKLISPDILITIGGQTGDYSIYGTLKGFSNVEHWRVCEDGNVVDTYDKLTKIFECPDYYFFERMAAEAKCEHSYYESLRLIYDTLNYDVDLPFSNLYVAQQLYQHIPNNSIMNFAILNSLRCWSYFPLDSSIVGYANIAAFGIDGCNSMLIGESMNTNQTSFIVTGDLAFFYDMNALGIRHIKNNLRILLINNSGGAEFKIMTKNWKKNINVNSYISAEGHNGFAEGWAKNCGFGYLKATNKHEFLQLRDTFISTSDKPLLFEIQTDSEDEVLAINSLISANSSIANRIKSAVSEAIGPKGINMIKKIIK